METIPPLNNMQNLTTPAEKTVEGVVENLPETLKEAFAAGGVSFKAEIQTLGMFLDKLGVMLKLPSIDGKITELPLELNLRGTRVDLPSGTNEAVIRLQPSGTSAASFRIVSINNLPAENLISSGKSDVPAAKKTETLIIKNPADFKQISLQPLDVKPLLEGLSEKIALPADIKSGLTEIFKSAEIRLELIDVRQPAAKENLPLSSSAKGNAVSGVLEKITAVLQKFDGNSDSQSLKNLAETLEKELVFLSNRPLAGKVSAEAGLNVIKTPLGNVFAEKPLKLPEGTEVLLQIKDMAETSLIRDFSSSRLLQMKSPDDFYNILKPLHKPEYEPLLQEISSKLPALNEKMLPNMVSFIKGALSHKLADWLGPEISERLNASGAEGQETASRLNGILANAGREGSGWRIVEVPFYDGNNIGKIKVAVKKNNEEENQSNRKKQSPAGTRFVVDTSFSRLGDFQFDGFSITGARRFDLIIRTGRDIGDDIYANLFRIFKNTLYELEYSGNLKVNVKENFIKICEDNQQTETLSNGIYI